MDSKFKRNLNGCGNVYLKQGAFSGLCRDRSCRVLWEMGSSMKKLSGFTELFGHLFIYSMTLLGTSTMLWVNHGHDLGHKDEKAQWLPFRSTKSIRSMSAGFYLLNGYAVVIDAVGGYFKSLWAYQRSDICLYLEIWIDYPKGKRYCWVRGEANTEVERH